MTQQKWQTKEKKQWLSQQSVKRSYFNQVINPIDRLKKQFNVEQYAALSFDKKRYPLFLIKTRAWNEQHKNILITGGVHGYETSGILGALHFLKEQAQSYEDQFNFIVAPCVSPWGFETINRWNPFTFDPNRSFIDNSPAEESKYLMSAILSLNIDFLAHFDLHETTDTDNSIFRPALAAKDGVEQDSWCIPDGFYLVGDSEKPVDDFQTAIINSVKQVTHVAPPDPQGKIIGAKLSQAGVINYPTKKLGLCTGFTGCDYSTTTEMYPDSEKVTEQDCVLAQVAAVIGGLNYLAGLPAS